MEKSLCPRRDVVNPVGQAWFSYIKKIESATRIVFSVFICSGKNWGAKSIAGASVASREHERGLQAKVKRGYATVSIQPDWHQS